MILPTGLDSSTSCGVAPDDLCVMDSLEYPVNFRYTRAMPYFIAYPYDPDDLEARYPPFMKDVLDLKLKGNHQAVEEIIKMVRALKELGLDCGFVKKLKGSPLLELRTHSRGGNKGGVRVYFFQAPNNTFMLCRAEWKQGSKANQTLLEDSAYILLAFKQNRPVFPGWMNPKYPKGDNYEN
jgi:hypothetical protein